MGILLTVDISWRQVMVHIATKINDVRHNSLFDIFIDSVDSFLYINIPLESCNFVRRKSSLSLEHITKFELV